MLRSLLSLTLSAVALAGFAAAQPIQAFSLPALRAAQSEGKPILVDAFAPWCPTCRAQAPSIERLASSPRYASLVILRLDFDNQANEKRALGITRQSTLIAYKGGQEVGRSLGVTDPDQITALAATTLK